MLNLPSYAGALRCIGQALQRREIEVFELKCSANEFHLLAGDPNPPYTGLLELQFSRDNIRTLDRDGRRLRAQTTKDVRFDSVTEILRAVGQYVDNRRGGLRRVNNSCSSTADQPTIAIEYETRTGDVITENLTLSLIREASVHMYKRRAQLSNPINILTRRN
jgi:hypothetical protein